MPHPVTWPTGMVTPKGYGMERHDVWTTDGYQIVNFRSGETPFWSEQRHNHLHLPHICRAP